MSATKKNFAGISTRAKAAQPSTDMLDAFVNGSEAAPAKPKVISSPVKSESMKRLTLDISESLHKRVKAQSAMRGRNMADLLREVLEREFHEM